MFRLAPEHPFPAGLNDVYDSLKWTIANAESLRIDPEKIVLAGTSGGALLAAAASHRARDEKLHPPIKTRYLAIPALLYPGGHTASFKEFMFIPGREYCFAIHTMLHDSVTDSWSSHGDVVLAGLRVTPFGM